MAALLAIAALGMLASPAGALPERLSAVLAVLYLVFNEGYAASSGEVFQRVDLSNEAIRLARAVHELLPESGEVGGQFTFGRHRSPAKQHGNYTHTAAQCRRDL